MKCVNLEEEKREKKGSDRQVLCPVCNSLVQGKERPLTEVYEVRGEEIEVHTRALFCPRCNTDLFCEELDEKTLLQVYEIYRQRHGLMSGEEIAFYRAFWGLSQEETSLLLGYSPRLVSRLEHGSLQSPEQEENLVLLRESGGVNQLLSRNRDRLEEGTLRRLTRRLTSLEKEEGREQREKALLQRLILEEASPYNGYTAFDYEKFCAMVSYLVQRGEGLLKVKLLKLLNYADMVFYKNWGRSISGSEYLHFAYGPVPRGYETLFEIMEEQGYLHREEITAQGYRRVLFSPGEEVLGRPGEEEKLLSEEERKTLEKVLLFFASFGSAEISSYSHRERGYINTRLGDLISYSYAKDLSL